jgi:uncharacterized cupredoxin-like copper-binding protein
MKTYQMVAAATLSVWLTGVGGVQAGTSQNIIESTAPTANRHPPAEAQFAALPGQVPIQVVLQFGTETKNFALIPKTLRFEKGKLYRLVIVNPSKTAHVVSAPEFGVAVDSISLMHGVALKQGDRQAWYFVADQAGTYDIMCAHKAHAEAGMVGKIIVSSRRD